MSFLGWVSPSGEARVAGNEPPWLQSLVGRVAWQAWDVGEHTQDRVLAGVVAMVQPSGYAGDPSQDLAVAWAAFERERVRHEAAVNAAKQAGNQQWWWSDVIDLQPRRDVVRLLRNLLGYPQYQGTRLRVGEVEVLAGDVALNSALAGGSDPVRLAAYLVGWQHVWVEGPDRAWLADIIDRGVEVGVLRRAIRGDGPDWRAMGWPAVAALLRARDDEPVVMVDSGEGDFPDPRFCMLQWPEVGDDWLPRWVDDEYGRAEWDQLSSQERAGYRNEEAERRWWELPDRVRWEQSMGGLRAARPWAQLQPATFGTQWFGRVPVCAWQLALEDREERVTAIVAGMQERERGAT